MHVCTYSKCVHTYVHTCAYVNTYVPTFLTYVHIHSLHANLKVCTYVHMCVTCVNVRYMRLIIFLFV